MRVRVFSTGRVRQKKGARGVRRYVANEWRDETLPVNVFLIEHPDGLCLVDAGQTAAAAELGYFPRWYPFFRLARFELGLGDEAAAQIINAGFDLHRVRWVVLTHLHTDHVGGLAPFRGAEVLVARREWERAQGIRGRLRGYLPQRWPTEVLPRIVDFAGPSIGPFEGSYDVASDGRLLMVPLPGHTPGHAGLLVKDPAGTFLCAGDVAERGADLGLTRGEVVEWCRRECVTLLTAHDDSAQDLITRRSPTRSRP